MRRLLLAVALILPAPLGAQGPRHATLPAAPNPSQLLTRVDSGPSPDDLGLALAGTLAGIGGLVAGGYIGMAIERSGGCSGDWCGFGGALLGGAVGMTIAIPAGVHMANGSRGDFGQAAAASGLALAGGILVSAMMQDATPILFVPIMQVVGAIAAERRASRMQAPI
jgi:hypothetical protein